MHRNNFTLAYYEVREPEAIGQLGTHTHNLRFGSVFL